MDMHFEGVIFHTHADELGRRLGHEFPPFAVLDVRSRADYAKSHIEGSIHVDSEKLARFPAGTDDATELFIVGTGHADPAVRRAALALKELGARRLVELTGGYTEWRRKGLPEEAGQAAA